MLDVRRAISNEVESDVVLKIRCPAHDDSTASLAVYQDHIHCFGCGIHKTGEEAIRILNGPDADISSYQVSDPKPDSNSDSDKDSPLIAAHADLYHRFMCEILPERTRWLHRRGINSKTIEMFNLGHTGSHFVIPVYDENKNLATLRFRADPEICSEATVKRSKYMGLKGFNGCYPYPAWLPATDTVVIVEGEFDVMRLWSLGIPAYTTTNGASQVHRIFDLLPSLRCINHLIIATDQDEQGEKAAIELMQYAHDNGMSWERWRWEGDAKDVSEYCTSPAQEAVLKERYQSARERR